MLRCPARLGCPDCDRRNKVMNDHTDQNGQAEEGLLTCTISDEGLEVVAAPRGGRYTYGPTNCIECTASLRSYCNA